MCDLDAHPTRVLLGGRPAWQWPDGTTLPVVAGGAGDNDDGGGSGGGGGGQSGQGGGQGGTGGGGRDDDSGGGDDDDQDDDGEKDWQAEARKWKSLSRKHESQAKANADAAKRLKELEDKDKSESERLADELKAAKAEGQKATHGMLRLEVALDKAPEGMPVSRVRKLAARLQGDTREELEADADELFADFAGGDDGEGDKPKGRERPKERLRPGAAPDTEPEETDPRKLAAKVPRL